MVTFVILTLILKVSNCKANYRLQIGVEARCQFNHLQYINMMGLKDTS